MMIYIHTMIKMGTSRKGTHMERMQKAIENSGKMTHMIAENMELKDTNRLLTHKIDEKVEEDSEFLLKVVRALDEKQIEIDRLADAYATLNDDTNELQEAYDIAMEEIKDLRKEIEILRSLLR